MDQYQFVTTAHGTTSYIELPGAGPDMLMLHAPGFCAGSMERVVDEAGVDAHVVSVDLPAHGSSAAAITDATGATSWLREVMAALDLDRPVLFGCDMSAFTVAAAAAAGSGPASALVLVGGQMLLDRQGAAEQLDFMTSPAVLADLAARMGLGREGDDHESMLAARARIAEVAKRDWLIEDRTEVFADKITSIFDVGDDGHWVRRPTPEHYAELHAIAPDADPYPERGLLDRIDAPIRIVVGSEGVGGDLAEDAGESFLGEHVTVDLVDGGNNLAMTRTADVAQSLRDVLRGVRPAG